MDFKIAGTKKGITAMQLDVKLSDGVPSVILEEALDHARIGILYTYLSLFLCLFSYSYLFGWVFCRTCRRNKL
jgi:polyribonucleotide nucleotidyltransferase